MLNIRFCITFPSYGYLPTDDTDLINWNRAENPPGTVPISVKGRLCYWHKCNYCLLLELIQVLMNRGPSIWKNLWFYSYCGFCHVL